MLGSTFYCFEVVLLKICKTETTQFSYIVSSQSKQHTQQVLLNSLYPNWKYLDFYNLGAPCVYSE